MNHPPATIEEAQRLLSRLEHMSVDSAWARRASGVRGGMLHLLSELEPVSTLNLDQQLRLNQLVAHAYVLLVYAARELRGQDTHG